MAGKTVFNNFGQILAFMLLEAGPIWKALFDAALPEESEIISRSGPYLGSGIDRVSDPHPIFLNDF